MMHCYMLHVTSVANATGDKLCSQLFFDAGYQLGRHVMALIPQVDPVSILTKANSVLLCISYTVGGDQT